MFIEAVKSLGFKHHADLNANSYDGFGRFHYTAHHGRRETTAKAFLRPARNRPNLKIMLRAFVEKVLINNANVATGVRVTRYRDTFHVAARKEVILCTGAIVSPSYRVLMLSVGTRSHLTRHGIPVKRDLPVGFNMQTHYGVREPIFLVDEPITFSELEYFNPVNWLRHGTYTYLQC